MFDREDYIKEDSPIKNILLKFFKKSDRLNIFDIGACEGEETIRYKKIFPLASVDLFEPLPKNQELILENIKKNNLKNVRLHPIALSDVNSFTKLYISSGRPNEIQANLDWDFGNKSSSLLAPELNNMPEWLHFNEEIEVQTKTLDSFLVENNIDSIDFVHMDVQGAELKVLEGAKEKLQNIKSIWLEVANIELYKTQPLTSEIEVFMQENNFTLIKSEFSGEFGDQFYVNKSYFRTYSFFNKKFQFHFKLKKNVLK
ncbi:FkbM family methyltransferase [Flavobacterium sp.]|uniref:FkbM family methyltransferase n=1 Tax=Flavobacterium sp. TaxID=239 RepID=UPI0026287BCA|nr:FkbM family methyltransferase [Flavobacterium sp.]MDG2433720.1 FkbM family methyltransferase [Flavobacterium sp.]